jgi:hypothetical protein
MKKTILSLVGVFTLLSSAIGFNVYKHYEQKHDVIFVGKYYWGFNVEELGREPGMYQGSNYRVMVLRNKKGGHTIGNQKYGFYTWYMNR